jgi:hypothetical protein
MEVVQITANAPILEVEMGIADVETTVDVGMTEVVVVIVIAE